jgi:hypothetical protein
MFASSFTLLIISILGQPDHPLEFYIEKLGSIEASAQLEHIDRFGCTAVPELVKYLRIVPSGRYMLRTKPDDTFRTIYIIASLRYITAHDFYGRISKRSLQRFDSAGRDFLTQDAPPRRAKFFGWWPSHGSFYLAPPQTQAEIISSWKAYARSGACKHSSWDGRTSSRFYLSGAR